MSEPRPDEKLLAMLGIDLTQVRARVDAAFGADAIDNLCARARPGAQVVDGSRTPTWPVNNAPRQTRARTATESGEEEHRSIVTSIDLLIGLLEVYYGMAIRLPRRLGVDVDV